MFGVATVDGISWAVVLFDLPFDAEFADDDSNAFTVISKGYDTADDALAVANTLTEGEVYR